jgi:outer membrane protein OmpA-like peptidoglycan-associated protein
LLICFIAGLSIQSTFAEDYIKVFGKVKSTDENVPIDGFVSLTYQTQPNGNEYGIMKVNGSENVFEFNLRKDTDYIIQAKSPGFTASTQLVDYLESVSGGVLELEIFLVPAQPGMVLEMNQLLFDQGKFEIKPESIIQLGELSTTLEINPDMVIQIEGHTDYAGGDDQNMELSKNRVEEVKYHLMRSGIHQSRLKTRAFGGTQPKFKTNDEKLRKLNRRVEVRILEI